MGGGAVAISNARNITALQSNTDIVLEFNNSVQRGCYVSLNVIKSVVY